MTSRCEQHPGMCCHDHACPDKHCQGRPEDDEPAIGYEAARLIQDEGGITYAGDEPRKPFREPISGEAKFLIGALICTWAIVAALYRFDSLVLLWPRLVAALSN